MTLLARVANRVFMGAAFAAARRFDSASRDPATAQRRILHRILRDNAESEAGRRFAFHSISSPREFRRRVPIRGYDDTRADVGRMAHGAANVLTSHRVHCFEETTGSASRAKLIPYTRPLLNEFSQATLPWTFDLLHARPGLRDGRAYWAVSPSVRRAHRTDGGIPIGLAHDSDYFPVIVRRLLDATLGTPRALSLIRDVAASRYVTLRVLLGLADLAFVSVWNPSFLTLLASALDQHWPDLLRDLERGTLSCVLEPETRGVLSRALPAARHRATALRRAFGARPPDDLGRVWPNLAMISCWTDGHARRAVAAMRERFPGVEVQGKGLLATEGVASFPLLSAEAAVAAVTSHFLEFVPRDHDQAVGAHELEVDATYEVLLTTSGGLYRYALKDVVRVRGWYRQVPLLTFEGRSDRTSDLVGEKLTPVVVERALEEALRETRVPTAFALLAPAWDTPPHYRLYMECEPADADRLARALETRLVTLHHYALARSLGQLGPVRPVRVHAGENTYDRVCRLRGQRSGTVKPAALDPAFGWELEFTELPLDMRTPQGAA